MNQLDVARTLQAERNYLVAVRAFDDYCSQASPAGDDLLDFAVAALSACDGGYVAHHDISQSDVDYLWDRCETWLAEARTLKEYEGEAEFWTGVAKFVVLGEEPPLERWAEMLRQRVTLAPAMFLCDRPDISWTAEAEELLRLSVERRTARQDYAWSILSPPPSREGRHG